MLLLQNFYNTIVCKLGIGAFSKISSYGVMLLIQHVINS